mmetsp:Transcript_21245/g.47207  ORF Transcript_21245/g.47207 Transcript_21245/m.47207 type:complete len:212 (-) Transcript_21245:121-756(-)
MGATPTTVMVRDRTVAGPTGVPGPVGDRDIGTAGEAVGGRTGGAAGASDPMGPAGLAGPTVSAGDADGATVSSATLGLGSAVSLSMQLLTAQHSPLVPNRKSASGTPSPSNSKKTQSVRSWFQSHASSTSTTQSLTSQHPSLVSNRKSAPSIPGGRTRYTQSVPSSLWSHRPSSSPDVPASSVRHLHASQHPSSVSKRCASRWDGKDQTAG